MSVLDGVIVSARDRWSEVEWSGLGWSGASAAPLSHAGVVLDHTCLLPAAPVMQSREEAGGVEAHTHTQLVGAPEWVMTACTPASQQLSC